MKQRDREELNAIRSMKGRPDAPELEPSDEAEHFYVCKACGQAVDKRRLGDVFHHEEAGHEPLSVS
jgi:hypothetical protein